MKILFAISILSFCLLLWAVLAIMRHIRRAPASPIAPSDPEAIPEPQPDLTLDPDTARRRFKTAGDSFADSQPSPSTIKPAPRFASGARMDRRYSDGPGGDLRDPDNGLRRRFTDNPGNSSPSSPKREPKQ